MRPRSFMVGSLSSLAIKRGVSFHSIPLALRVSIEHVMKQKIVGLRTQCNAGTMATSQTGVPLHEQHLLDMGCGTGNYVSKLVDKVGSVAMQDFSEGMLDKARAKFDK